MFVAPSASVIELQLRRLKRSWGWSHYSVWVRLLDIPLIDRRSHYERIKVTRRRLAAPQRAFKTRRDMKPNFVRVLLLGLFIIAFTDADGSPTRLVETNFSDAKGWNRQQYYSTIRYADINGDGKSDICGRGTAGVYCAISDGTKFQNFALWLNNFSDANHWDQPQYYSTISFPDLNGDGKVDICGRGGAGVYCALSNGGGFQNFALWMKDFSDANHWDQPQYYSTITFADVNGDGKADVCGRGAAGVYCALSTGSGFGKATLWETTFSDANSWDKEQYYSTIRFVDVNNDGRADLCGRGALGIYCALSNGSGFGKPTLWNVKFSDANHWDQSEYYSTIRIVGGTLCARGAGGIDCAFSDNAGSFVGPELTSMNESDQNGWKDPKYYTAFALTKDLRIAARGTAGIWAGDGTPSDRLSLRTAANIDLRRQRLRNKIWGSITIDATQEVDSDQPISTPDVPPPADVTVRRYLVNMTTTGNHNVQGLADHYVVAGSHKLVIVNPGHTCHYGSNTYQDIQMVQDLLAEGYSVLATYMPLFTPLDCSQDHDRLFDLNDTWRPANGFNPVFYFLDPVRRGLNHAIRVGGYTQIYMTGLSGGGWTTTLYAALDPRVQWSVPIAGSEPFYVRPTSDAEQENAPDRGNDLFDFFIDASAGIARERVVTGYKDFYLMGAFGPERRQIQVLNRNDDCCFGQNEFLGYGTATWDQVVRQYEKEIRAAVLALGSGSFRVEINEADDCNLTNKCTSSPTTTLPNRHEFAKNTRTEVVLTELNGSAPFLGGAATGDSFARGMNGRFYRHSGATWTDTGLAGVGTPSALSNGNMIDLFFRSEADQLQHARLNGAGWLIIQDVGGTIISDPEAVSWGAGRIDVIAVGTDYRLHHWSRAGTGLWSQSTVPTPNVSAVGQAALATAGVNSLDMFFRGHDSLMYHVHSNGAAPYHLESTGRLIKNFPATLATSGQLWVYHVGRDDALYEGSQVSAGGSWTWTNFSATATPPISGVAGTPAATLVLATGGRAVCARTSTNTLVRFTGLGTSWTANVSGVKVLGPPSGTAAGVIVGLDSDQSAWSFDTGGFHPLGGYIDR